MLQKTPHTQVSFNYDIVAEPVAVEAREAAQRIRLRLRRSAEDIIEIGRDLITVKGSIGHGNFLPWIEAEFGMGQSTADRFMQVAKVYGGKLPTVGNLPPTALYELAAPKTPLEVREEIEKMIEAGEVVTKAEVIRLKAEFEAAKRGKDLAEQDAEEAEKKLTAAQASERETLSQEVTKAVSHVRSAYEEEIQSLRKQIEDLQKPKNITTIDNETGNIVQFHRALTSDEKAEIDAVEDDMIGADFNEVASQTERAIAFFGAVRAMASAKADPAAVYAYITKRPSQNLVAEYMGMVDVVLSQLKSVKEMHNG